MNTRLKQMSVLLEKEANVKLQENRGLRRITSGRLVANGQEKVGDSFWPHMKAKGIRFKCWGNTALLPAFTCETKSQNTVKSKSSVGKNGSYEIIEVGFTTTYEVVDIFFQTTDANGGHANWELIF